ncbi:MAG: MTH938/NDUFAF3 family protein [Rhodospirillales bacterium]|nr:MTH938/NDUFAF3 family protein [Rhodospirillales bacterium]
MVVHPDRVEDSWWRKEGHNLAPGDLGSVWETRPDVLVVGTGFHGNMRVPEEIRRFSRSLGIELRAAPTCQTVTDFNDLASDPSRKVSAAFHLTC